MKRILLSWLMTAAFLAGCNGGGDLQNVGNFQLSLTAKNLRYVYIYFTDMQGIGHLGDDELIYPNEDEPGENEHIFRHTVAQGTEVKVYMNAYTSVREGENQGIFRWDAVDEGANEWQGCVVSNKEEDKCIIKGRRTGEIKVEPRFMVIDKEADGNSDNAARLLVHQEIAVQGGNNLFKTHFNLDGDGHWRGSLIEGETQLLQIVKGPNDTPMPIYSKGGDNYCQDLIIYNNYGNAYERDSDWEQLENKYKFLMNKDLDRDCAVEINHLSEINACVGDCAGICPAMDLRYKSSEIPQDDKYNKLRADLQAAAGNSLIFSEDGLMDKLGRLQVNLPVWQSKTSGEFRHKDYDISCTWTISMVKDVVPGTIYSVNDFDMPVYAPICQYQPNADFQSYKVAQRDEALFFENLHELTRIPASLEDPLHDRFLALSAYNNVVMLAYDTVGDPDRTDTWTIKHFYPVQGDTFEQVTEFKDKIIHPFSTTDGQYGAFLGDPFDASEDFTGQTIGYLFGERSQDHKNIVLHEKNAAEAGEGSLDYQIPEYGNYRVLGLISRGSDSSGVTTPLLVMINNQNNNIYVLEENNSQPLRTYSKMDDLHGVERVFGDLDKLYVASTWAIGLCGRDECRVVELDLYSQLYYVNSITIDSDYVYAASFNGQAVYRSLTSLSEAGTEEPLTFAEYIAYPVLDEVESVAFGSDKTIYYLGGILKTHFYSVSKTENGGEKSWQATRLSGPSSDIDTSIIMPGTLTYDYKGNILVGDSRLGSISIFEVNTALSINQTVGEYSMGGGYFIHQIDNYSNRNFGRIVDIKINPDNLNYYIASSLGSNYLQEDCEWNCTADRGIIYGTLSEEAFDIKIMAGQINIRGLVPGAYNWGLDTDINAHSISFGSNQMVPQQLAMLDGVPYFNAPEVFQEANSDGTGRMLGLNGQVKTIGNAFAGSRTPFNLGPNVTVKDKNGHELLFMVQNQAGKKIEEAALVCRNMSDNESKTFALTDIAGFISKNIGEETSGGTANISLVELEQAESSPVEDFAIRGITSNGRDILYLLVSYYNDEAIIGISFAEGLVCAQNQEQDITAFVVAKTLKNLGILNVSGLAYVPADEKVSRPGLVCFGDKTFGHVRCVIDPDTIGACQTGDVLSRGSDYCVNESDEEAVMMSSVAGEEEVAFDCGLFQKCESYYNAIGRPGSSDEFVIDYQKTCPLPANMVLIEP